MDSLPGPDTPTLLETKLREELVICILFFNKVDQTIDCIRSFAAADVAINVYDNGSEPGARVCLDEAVRMLPRVTVHGEGKNFGVSGGRNRQISATTQPWLFFVDNDITVSTSDWLLRMALAIRSRPAAEVFVPRMYNKHDGSWGGLADFVVDSGGNCTFVASERPYGNAFPGGASVISRSLFERCGLYDEDLFVGFEDFELAIRAWKKGRPVLVARCDGIELIHDHQVSTSIHDKAAAKVRYDVKRITHSHRCIEEKHRVLLDPNFSNWLQEQIAQVTGEASVATDATAPREFPFGRALPIRTPAWAGDGAALVLFAMSPDPLRDWLRLRALAIAKKFSRAAGQKVTVRALSDASCGDRDEWLVDARAAGLVDEIGSGGEPLAGFPDGRYFLVVAHLDGLVGSDFLIQAMQVARFEPDGLVQLMVPELTVRVAPDGSGERRMVQSLDPLSIQAGQIHFVAAADLQWARLAADARASRCKTLHSLVETWVAQSTQGGARLRPLRGSLSVELAKSVAPIGDAPRPWIASQWFAQSNLREVLRHYPGAGVSWNHFPLLTAAPPQRALAPGRTLDRVRTDGLTHLLLLPWLKPGGADRAALAYLKVLAQRYPGRVAAITTELVDSPWSAYIPDGARLILWRDFAAQLTGDDRVRGLLQFAIDSRVQVLHVMNSMLGWQLLAAHGHQLRSFTRVYASLFWYGPSPENQILGYAVDFLPLVQGKIDGIITDNESFRIRLRDEYGVGRSLTWCVYHPTNAFVAEPAVRDAPSPTLLWAGRFAPEKELGVLRAVAERLSSVRFRVFGSMGQAHPDTQAELARLRSMRNLSLEGAFDDFAGLPLTDVDALLYTSSSDGMPNVLVEAAAHGLPVVAPDVGGIGELVDQSTGWLISRWNDVDEYCAKIEAALADSNERSTRAMKALQRTRERHSYESFVNQLARVPGYLF
jgi:GT2 family glycosyltransferase/glycosyltransferase involved in cell wall biosynthesis